MPALVGESISTLRDGNGNPVFIIYMFWNQANGNLRNVTQATSDGTKTGAVIVDNMTTKAQLIHVTNDAGQQKTLNIPANGAALTVAQLAALAPPNGPFNTIQDLAGVSPSIS